MFPGVTGHAAIVPAPGARTPVYRQATAASSQRYEIPDNWLGHIVRFEAKGDAVDILFGDSAVSVTLNEVSSLSTETLTADVNSGGPIPAGGFKDIYVDKNYTHFAVVASGTSGFWSAQRTQV